MIYLKEANVEDIEKEYAFVRDMPENENGFTNAWHGIARKDFEEKALQQMIDSSKGVRLPDGYVPQTFFFLWQDDEIVGQFRIRHHLSESLRTGAGHIGYFIRRDCRGRGLAKAGLQRALEIAKAVIPEDEIYLRVNKDNQASWKVMLHHGGYIEHEDANHYYVRIKTSD